MAYDPSMTLHNRLEAQVGATIPCVVGTAFSTNGTFFFTTGYFGQCISFPGTVPALDYVNFTCTPGLKGCIEFWIKFNGFSISNANISDGGVHFFVGPPQGAWTPPLYYIVAQDGYGIRVGFVQVSTYIEAQCTTSSWSDATWYHCAASWSDASDFLKLYQDGVEIASNTLSGNAITTPCDASLGDDGHSGGAGYSAKALIDNAKMWNYPKHDFSDRFTEYSYAYVPPGIVTWTPYTLSGTRIKI